jgi:hypothetical protein
MRAGLRARPTVFCGDSGSDLSKFGQPVPSVLVANSRRMCRTSALELAEEAGTLPLHIAARLPA